MIGAIGGYSEPRTPTSSHTAAMIQPKRSERVVGEGADEDIATLSKD
jgi:hypothetical protein